MTQEQSNPNAGQTDPTTETDPDKLRDDIAETRGELGETVEALSEKADVKAQARAKADEVKANARAKADEAKATAGEVGGKAKQNPVPFAAGGVVVLLILLWLIRRD